MNNKIAAIQMTSTSDVDKNLAQVSKLLIQSIDKGACIAVLPEMFPILAKSPQDKLAIAERIGSGKIQDFLATFAQKHRLWIVGGTIPIQSSVSTRPYASCLVFNDEGRSVARYDKIHLFDVRINAKESYKESENTMPGTQLSLVDTPLGKMGIAVCYDLRFPEMFRCLLNQGAEIFAIPSAFTVKTGQAHLEALMRTRAIENGAYVVTACQTGEHDNGRQTYGHSMIISPWGTILEILKTEVGVISAEIDLNALQATRETIPVLEHQKMRLNEFKISSKLQLKQP